MDLPDLRSPEHYINRELSLLEFNGRVLAQALDEKVPLLERLKFLCISSSNLDEFFEIRVAGLKQRIELGSDQPGPDGMAITDQLRAIHERTCALVDAQYHCLNDVLLPAMRHHGIELLARATWDTATAQWLENYFEREVEPVLSPLALDPARPFPRIQNKSLNFIVRLAGQDAFGRDTGLAVVQAPRSLPRVVALPQIDGQRRFVLLTGIVQQFVSKLFSGMEVLGCYQFRVTRNSDLFVDDEEVDDLRRALEGELAHRRYGAAVRLEVSRDCPPDLDTFLMRQFTLSEVDFYEVEGPVNLSRLAAIYDLVQRPDLKYPIFTPGLPRRVAGSSDLFAVIRHKDVLLHHPFHSFGPVMDFLRGAAADPRVLAIKQTLYRAGDESPIVDALVAAAHSGKDVTVIVELRARFDEEANIELSNLLQEAGAHVMYGVVGFKTHAKMSMVVRREAEGLRRYCHLGTGNYHPRTARTYTDYSLFTCDPVIGQDVHELFLQLTSLTQTPHLTKLLQSPFDMHPKVIEKIDRVAGLAIDGRPGRIIAKMNSLVDPKVIEALYRASRAGVQIELIIRGLCALRPGIPGVSDNIRVRSVIGRFLEHSRVFYFSNGEDNEDTSELYLASADWMERNFFRRVEIAFPVREQTHRDRILRDLNSYIADNTQAWALGRDGRYTRVVTEPPPYEAQGALLARYAAGSAPPIVP
ncbi:MAG: polyphosphate kinase 1 [Steroidobacteraceae bacterium]|nr:polyphosphate kinase 1 [Steroidobacteraceae bacterium]